MQPKKKWEWIAYHLSKLGVALPTATTPAVGAALLRIPTAFSNALELVHGVAESLELGVVNVFTDSGTETSGPMISSGQALG
jgi:hypothetical protein